MNDAIYGYCIVGSCSGERRLVDVAAAFASYAACDQRAHVDREVYLSAFWFTQEFADYLRTQWTTKGFTGTCWSPFLWFDVDREGELDRARIETAQLVHLLCDRYALSDDDLLICFSGAKGFHVGLPIEVFAGAGPSPQFNLISRRLAEGLAARARIEIDIGIYDQVRAFRAPNSRHPKTGLHKRRLPLKALMELGAPGIAELAKSPEPFEIPVMQPGRCDWHPSTDWAEAATQLDRAAQEIAQHRAAVVNGVATATLNRLTMEFIQNGAEKGDRHRLLYSAARNLGDFGCPPALAHALLTEAALDSGLPPKEVHRQIERGLKDAENNETATDTGGAL